MHKTLKRSEIFSLAKIITLLVGLLAMFLAGICYMVMSDLGFGNLATWLIVATVLSMGSAICQFFSVNMKDFPVKQIILRSIAVALAIGFVVFLHVVTGTEFYQSITPNKVPARNACTTVSLILGYLALVSQIANLVLIATVKDE